MPSSSLKIGIILDSSLDPPDGVQQYVTQVGEWLRANGHDVHYLVGETTRTDLQNIHSMSRNFTVTFNGNKTTIPLWLDRQKARKLLRQEHFDVLHVQSPHHPLMAQKIIKMADERTAVIGTFHILPYGRLAVWGTKLLGILLEPSLQRIDQMFAVSTAALKFEEDNFKLPAIVVPNVVKLKEYKAVVQKTKLSKGSKKKIVFLGRLVPRKGARQLLQAIATLPKDLQDNLEVIIGGKGELLDELMAYAKDAKISEIVSFAGFVPEEDKVAFLHQADIAIFPSIAGESFGIVLLEAMAAESKVVLGGNNPGYATVLADWPHALFDPNDTEALAALLQRYLTNSSLSNKLHAQQQKAIKQYDIDTVGEKIVANYQNAIAKRLRKLDNKR